MLNDVYEDYEIEPSASLRINSFLNLELDDKQRWTICWNYSPMISKFEKDKIVIDGCGEKGQLRPAILSYLHFFIGEDPVLRNAKYGDLSFLNTHSLNGVVDAEKHDANTGTHSRWLYLIENENTYSIDGVDYEEFMSNPKKHSVHKVAKNDHCQKMLASYFPPVYSYAKIVKSVVENETVSKKHEKAKNKI